MVDQTQLRGLAKVPPERRREIARLGGKKSCGGFAKMAPERRREAARLGGKNAQAHGTGYRWSREAAKEAGRKGGKISRRGPATVKQQESL